MATKRRPTTPDYDDGTMPEYDDAPTPVLPAPPSVTLPSVERVQQELAGATSIDDFFGKEGIFARLCASTLAQLLDAEWTAQRGSERDAAAGRHAGNRRNGTRQWKLRRSGGDVTMQVPRDRNGSFQSPLREP